MNYEATHASVRDNSTAMVVSRTAHTITLINEDGYEWTDPSWQWFRIDEPDGAAVEQWEVTTPDDVYHTDEYYSGTGELIADESYILFLDRY